MEAAEGTGSGTKVIDAKGVAFSYGEQEIVRDFTLRIHRGDRIGIVGPNGAGKTTLLEIADRGAFAAKRQCQTGTRLADGCWTRTAANCIPNSRWRRR
jgi:ATP-binding cassette subfamily F protein uup